MMVRSRWRYSGADRGSKCRPPRQLLAIEPDPSATLIVLEATGTYWMRLAKSLSEAGFAVSVINPTQAHAFAKALLKRSKTDAIDAQTLAELGARLQPECWTPPPQVYTELAQRLVHRDGLVVARTQFRNQRMRSFSSRL
ncbi:MAG: transposase [Kouleothrix sp.]|nr:transposase [Kouleothrix sp.]